VSYCISLASRSLVRFGLGALVLAAFLSLPPAIAEEAASSGHDHHAHHHHEVPAGVRRSEASYAIPDVTLVNQEGQRVAARELLSTDKPVLANFIFTTCTAICPAMSATFTQVQQGLVGDSDKVMMVSFSIDPEQDTPKALAAYAKRFNAGPQWVFLTGSLDDSIAVQKAFDAYRGDKMNHVPLTLLRAAPDAQWVRYDGFASAADLVQDVRGMIRR
jgi:protein SCO1/2